MSQDTYPVTPASYDQPAYGGGGSVPQNKKKKSPYVLFAVVAVVCIIIIIALIIVVSMQKESGTSKETSETPQSQSTDTTTVAFTVGEEKIYQKDLEMELARYPQDQRAELRDRVIEKMREDAIILQGAAEDGIIELDESIYGDPTKDYAKRLETLNNIRTTIESEKVAGIEGHIVSIWPHNGTAGPLGYERARQIAKEKIDGLYQDVQSGEITIVEAGEQIRNDQQLADIDTNYKGNAIFAFRATPGEEITGDSEFNDMLHNAGEGEVTEVYASEYPNSEGETVVWYYRFGQVTKVINSDTNSYEEWLLKKKQSIQ